MQTPTSKEELLAIIPKLRKVPNEKPPEFYKEIAERFMAPVKDELDLDAKIDDLINEIQNFCDEDDDHHERKVSVWAKKAVKSFIDAKIFSTKKGRELLLDQIERLGHVLMEATPFEERVIEIITMLARHSFVLSADGEISANIIGRPIPALMRVEN